MVGCLLVIIMWFGIAVTIGYPQVPNSIKVAMIFPGVFIIVINVIGIVARAVDRRNNPAKYAFMDYYEALTGKKLDL